MIFFKSKSARIQFVLIYCCVLRLSYFLKSFQVDGIVYCFRMSRIKKKKLYVYINFQQFFCNYDLTVLCTRICG